MPSPAKDGSVRRWRIWSPSVAWPISSSSAGCQPTRSSSRAISSAISSPCPTGRSAGTSKASVSCCSKHRPAASRSSPAARVGPRKPSILRYTGEIVSCDDAGPARRGRRRSAAGRGAARADGDPGASVGGRTLRVGCVEPAGRGPVQPCVDRIGVSCLWLSMRQEFERGFCSADEYRGPISCPLDGWCVRADGRRAEHQSWSRPGRSSPRTPWLVCRQLATTGRSFRIITPTIAM